MVLTFNPTTGSFVTPAQAGVQIFVYESTEPSGFRPAPE
jgi:hypothetical protein